MAFNDFSMVLTVVLLLHFVIFFSVLHYKVTAFVTAQCSNKLMLSYSKYYIIRTQQARKSIVLKLCGYAAAFKPHV